MELLGNPKPSTLPSCEFKQELSDRIATDFVEKIIKIRCYLDELQHEVEADLGLEMLLVPTKAHFIAFDLTTEEVQKVIMAPVSKSHYRDTVLIYIAKKCLHILLPIPNNNQYLICIYQSTQLLYN